MCTGEPCDHGVNSPSRRSVLGGIGISATAFLAGCLGGEQSQQQPPPDPIALSGGKQCDVCGMVIGDHAGANGQVFYSEQSPESHENPARFDSLKACMFPYYFQHKRRDWEALALYVTDYSVVDYTVTSRDDQKYISSHTTADAFANAEELNYVVESRVHGAMGADFIPFSARADAETFTEDYGGRTVHFDDITPELLSE